MSATDETRRLSLRIDRDLKHRVTEEAERRGQSLTVFVERALEAALSEANGAVLGMQVDPAPVPSHEGVRSTAPPRAPVPPIGQDAENERAFRARDAGTPLPKYAARKATP
jgi:hypothetical protein